MAQGFTTITYGNISIFRCTTRSITQVPVWDESGTDILYMKTTVSVTGYLNGRSTYYDPPNTTQYDLTNDRTNIPPSGYASAREFQIRRQLGPRLPFVMLVGDFNGDGTTGQALLACAPAPVSMNPPLRGSGNINLSGVDVNNGPRCTKFIVTHIHGDELYGVEAEFEICKIECDVFGNVPFNSYGILSNRWSCADSLDSNLRTTRVYSGLLVLASANINAQQLRALVMPPMVRMMRRDNINVTASSDGLKLQWSVNDVEIAQSAPYPARTWNVTHRVFGENAMMGEATVDVELTGDSMVNKTDLIELALYLITAKLYNQTPNALMRAQGIGGIANRVGVDGMIIMKSIEFIDQTGDVNRISARCHVQQTMDTNAATVEDKIRKFGKPINASDVNITAITRDSRPPYDRAYSWGGYAGDVAPYASPAASILEIFIGFLQDPCNDNHRTATGVPTAPDLNPGAIAAAAIEPRADPPTYQVTVLDSNAPDPVDNPYLSDSMQNAAYTYWQLETVYKNKKMRIQLPIAATQTPGINYLPTSSLVRLAGSQVTQTIRVRAERFGIEPQFPDPENLPPFPPVNSGNQSGAYTGPVVADPNIKRSCLESNIRPSSPTITLTGQMLYRAEAEYVMALSREPNAGEQLDFGNNMWAFTGALASDVSGELTNSDWSQPGTDLANFS